MGTASLNAASVCGSLSAKRPPHFPERIQSDLKVPSLAVDTTDWKQKYRDSLLEMESEEKQWKQVEQALRRLIGRLCAAAMGVDPQLDDELVALAAANRKNADAAELERLAESLTMAVVAVDAVSPVPTIVLPPVTPPAPRRWESTCTAAATVLRRLQTLGHEDTAVQELTARLTKAATDGELAAILVKTAELVERHGERLASERLQAAAVLAEVTARLDEVAGYLTEAADAALSRFADTDAVNDQVMSQVRDLTAEVNGATELGLLQTLVTKRLAGVTQQVRELRAREVARLKEQTGRTEHMQTRIQELERETQELHTKLDNEKFGARHDALTLVGNRKAFDERLAQIMTARTPADPPAVMLLWDLDNFKAINDTYGHRAGDRVLKSVATCLVSALRPEDFVARIGGEEFIVLLCGVALERAAAIAEELRRAVELLRFHFRGAPVRVTMSCGLTELKVDDTGTAAFDRADAALYQAKRGGKNAAVTA